MNHQLEGTWRNHLVIFLASSRTLSKLFWKENESLPFASLGRRRAWKSDMLRWKQKRDATMSRRSETCKQCPFACLEVTAQSCCQYPEWARRVPSTHGRMGGEKQDSLEKGFLSWQRKKATLLRTGHSVYQAFLERGTTDDIPSQRRKHRVLLRRLLPFLTLH